MSWIKIIPPEAATDAPVEQYKRLASGDGQVDRVLQIHSLRPHTLEAHMGLYKASLHHPANTLPEWLLECIGIFVSRLNRCDYCDSHHSAGLARLLKDEQRMRQLDQALSEALPGTPFSTAEQVMFEYVRQLTLDPSGVQRQQVERMREAGYSDGQILEVNQAAAYFAYVNRCVLGLGVDIAGEALGMSPASSADINHWQHR